MPENKEEVQVLRLARILGDLITSEGWKEYEKVLRKQIDIREQALVIPLAELEGVDFMVRVAKGEAVKGALIGLRLALDLPTATIAHAKDIVNEHSKEENEP